MKITYRTGDMFAGPEAILIHGCNSRGIMGSGVAKLIREKYPTAYEDYRRAFDTLGLPVGGVIWTATNDRIIGNAITQKDFGSHPTKVYLSYDGLRTAMAWVNTMAGDPESILRLIARTELDPTATSELRNNLIKQRPLAVGMPRIGARRGGGKWATIAAIIEEESTHFEPVVYTPEGETFD